MMLIFAKAASWLAGPALLPIILAGGLWSGGKFLEARRTALINQGVRQCETDWAVRIARQHQAAAEALARTTLAERNALDVLNMELKANAADIERKFVIARQDADLARTALSNVDGKCISDRVRELARGVQGDGGSDSRAPSKDRR